MVYLIKKFRFSFIIIHKKIALVQYYIYNVYYRSDRRLLSLEGHYNSKRHRGNYKLQLQ